MKILLYLIMIISLLVLVGCTTPQPQNTPYHIHPTLEIVIFGEPYTIPANIGLSSAHHHPIHTHDTTGALHVESPVTRPFYLHEFFEIWDQRFDNQCILEYCNNTSHQVRVYVNEAEDSRFGDILLEQNQIIKIVYGER